ncbi:hypothetical protein HHK36_013079 [Tetracentron sinense]|uniref:FHA domain-containing protein n=1 Tax=Tetracentron sinense TaxID=13715 RepID=A0A834ZGG1_TETSI|nr:hypothetical protein HHK36_013079 [Tetracentron sinense]
MGSGGGGGGDGGDVEAGFAKLQGEDFEYYMQTYSIILGRNSKKSTVDVDLSTLGGGMNISRHHARIFYDFQRRRFALEVIGKNGCLVEGVLHLPGNSPVKLDSQDLLQIGDKKFYFLLPLRSILGGSLPIRRIPHPAPSAARLAPPPPPLFGSKKGRQLGDYLEEEDDDEYDEDCGPSKRLRRFGDGQEVFGYGAVGKGGFSGQLVRTEKKADTRSRADREADNHQLMQLEEKDVVSSVATVLSDLCGPGEWMPMKDLHSEVSLTKTYRLVMLLLD